MWQIVYGVESDQVHFSACLFQHLSFGTLLHSLPRFQESAGQIPQAIAGFNGPSGNENTVFPYGYAAHDHAWVLVVDHPATTTNETRQMIAFRDPEVQLGSAAF